MRLASTYRGARRNAVLRSTPRGVWEGYPARVIEQPPVRENKRDRSRDETNDKP